MGKHEPKMPDDLMSVKAAAEFLGLDERTIRNRCCNGTYPYWRNPISKPEENPNDVKRRNTGIMMISRSDLLKGFVKYG